MREYQGGLPSNLENTQEHLRYSRYPEVYKVVGETVWGEQQTYNLGRYMRYNQNKLHFALNLYSRGINCKLFW